MVPPTVTDWSPPIDDAPNIIELFVARVASADEPLVFKLTAPVKLFDVSLKVIAWFAPLVVKLEAPVVTVNGTAPVIVPVLAVAVKALKVEPPVENAILAEFKSTVDILVLSDELIPFTVIAPAVLSPMVSVPAVIFPNSAPEIVIFADVEPSPIVPASDTKILAVPDPVLIAPERLKSFAVIESVLPPVVKVPAELLKSPDPSLFESASKLTELPVVIFTP